MQRRFTLDDQVAFAHLSGDFNPIHVDPIAGRRHMFGEPVVHKKSDPGLTIYRPRLPRAATDQTVSLLRVENRDPVELMIDQLRHFRANFARKT
jgi:hypothetical protein